MADHPTRSTTASVPVHLYLSQLLDAHPDLTNVEMARRLGYPRPNVIAMMRTGTMKIPIQKVPDIARILDIEPLALFQRVLSEYDPDLWALLNHLQGPPLVTRHEMALVSVLRAETGNMDPDFVADRAFVSALKLLAAQAADRAVGKAIPGRQNAIKRDSAAIRLNQELEDLCRRQAVERLDLRRRLMEAG